MGRACGASQAVATTRFADVFGTRQGSAAGQAQRDAVESAQQQQAELNTFAAALAKKIAPAPVFNGPRRAAQTFAAELVASQQELQSVDAAAERLVACARKGQQQASTRSDPVIALKCFWVTLLQDDIPRSRPGLFEVVQRGLSRYLTSFPDHMDTEYLIREFCVDRRGDSDEYYRRLGRVCETLAAQIAEPPIQPSSVMTNYTLRALEYAPEDALVEGGALHSWIGAIEQRLTTPGGRRRKLSDFEHTLLEGALAAHPEGSPGGVALAPLRRWLRPAEDR